MEIVEDGGSRFRQVDDPDACVGRFLTKEGKKEGRKAHHQRSLLSSLSLSLPSLLPPSSRVCCCFDSFAYFWRDRSLFIASLLVAAIFCCCCCACFELPVSAKLFFLPFAPFEQFWCDFEVK